MDLIDLQYGVIKLMGSCSIANLYRYTCIRIHYQKVTFNNEDSCNEFLEEQRMNLAHDLIHIFEQTDKNLKGIKLTCQILKGDEV